MDIVGFLLTQEPIKSWSAAKKQEMLDLFCSARGYKEVYDEEENLVQTKREFVNQDVMNYILLLCNNEKLRKAREELTIESLEV